MKALLSLVLLFLATTLAGISQTAEIVAWDDFDAYTPMPVICIHGISSESAGCWKYGVEILSNYFSSVYHRQGKGIGPQVDGLTNQPSVAYVETFDYGVYGDPHIIKTRGHEQTFDSIKMNAYDGVYNKWGQTLKQRIDQVRFAYRDAANNQPPVILLTHSMGGVVSHYYLTKTGNDGSVLRLATFGTPHYGSYLPNGARCLISADGKQNRLLTVKLLQKGLSTLIYQDIDNFVNWAYPTLAHPEKQGMEHMSAPTKNNANPLITSYFKTQFVPHYVEYIFNSFRTTVNRWRYELEDGRVFWGLESSAQAVGDGVVPVWSQEGRSASGGDPDIMCGRYGLIRPLIFGITTDPNQFAEWVHLHLGETEVVPALLKSLCGVTYADSYNNPCNGENFEKYLQPNEDIDVGQTVCHSDEPGFRDLILLAKSTVFSNAFVISALNTWGADGHTPPQNIHTDPSDLVGHQLVGCPRAHLRVLGTMGAKNCAQEPLGNASDIDGINNYFWAMDGNEYLPASLRLKFDHSSSPNPYALPIRQGDGFEAGLVNSCLVILDEDGAPKYQYGLFDKTYADLSLSQSVDPTYIFTQGMNLAGLKTPIAERGFDVPVDSATVVNLLCGINEREAAAGRAQTPWTAYLTEWIDVPSNSSRVALNFFPQNNPDDWDTDVEITDAFTHGAYTNWTYSVPDKTFTLTNAPSCLQVSYTAYLGCKDSFTTNYEDDTGPSALFEVLPLTNANMLAGIPATPNLVQQMKTACRNLCPLFVDHTLGSQGDFNTWFAAHADATDFPMLDETSLAGVEDDYFESTPDMVSQREFDQVHTVLTNLQWTAVNLGAATVQCALGMGYGLDLTNAFQTAEADYQDYNLDAEANTYAECMGARSGGESAMLYNRRIMGMVTNVYAGAMFAVMTYAFPAPYETFDDNGQLPVAQLVPQRIDSQSGPGGQNGYWRAAQWFGARAIPSSQLPHWAEGWDTTRGYYAPLRAVLLWQFQYR